MKINDIVFMTQDTRRNLTFISLKKPKMIKCYCIVKMKVVLDGGIFLI